MEKKNSKILIGLIGVLLIFVVVLIGYIVTNSFKDNKCDDVKENSNNNQDINISNDFYNNILKNRKELKQIQTFSKFNIFGVVDLDGNVYIKLKEGMSLNKDSTKDFGTYGTYEIDGYYDSEGPDGSNIIEGYKLNIKNVVAVYETEAGNGGLSIFQGIYDVLIRCSRSAPVIYASSFLERGPDYNLFKLAYPQNKLFIPNLNVPELTYDEVFGAFVQNPNS